MSRIIVVGATGTIGKQVVERLSPGHEVVAVAHRSGPYRVDLADEGSIQRLFEQIGAFDALVSTAGQAKFGSLDGLTADDFAFGLNNKLMGQVNLVRVGRRYIHDGGSFTLTSGVLARLPMPGSAAVSMVNAAVEAFVRAAALELPRGIRINAVSPGWVKETMEAMGMDSSPGMPAAQVALAYEQSIASTANGEVLELTS